VIVAVVLAAGSSRRLGQPKQLVRYRGETLLERAVRVATEAGCAAVIAVVREGMYVPHACNVVNEGADEGMASSIRLGVTEAQRLGAAGVLVLACDQVRLSAEHVRTLCAAPERVMASQYAGRNGVPAYFPQSVFAQLLELRGDVGARELLRGAPFVSNEILALDLDTPEDLEALRGE